MGTIKGAVQYFEESKDTAWFNENVGISAPDDDTLVIELAKDEPYFLSRLTYSPFMPINPEKFVEEGGAFGVAAYAEAVAKEDYNYGNVKQLSSTYYNSAYYPTKITGGTGGEIIYTRNTNYYWNDQTNLNTLKWIYDKGDKPLITYASVVAGDITATGLSEVAGTLAKAKTDGYFAKYNYISDTNATTYLVGFNTNRGTFEVGETIATPQSEAQKIATNKAMNNLNFRRALQHAWDREVYNAKSKGTEVAKLSIRNLYTQPNFVRLSENVNYANHVFEAGLFYYEVVEYFLKNELGYHVDLSDSQDGWYNPLLARGYLHSAFLKWAKIGRKLN
jgi:ABC-type oligopeptide transport system substrate-binding subunit